MRKNISETIRKEMKDLYDAGLIDETTMRKFDESSMKEFSDLLSEAKRSVKHASLTKTDLKNAIKEARSKKWK